MLQKIATFSSLSLTFNMRIGFAKDIHVLKKGYPLILGSVKIPFKKGLVSYSDGDVVIHSIVDALLGAMCKGDIGKLFPDNDPINKGRSSIEFLKEVDKILKKEKYKIVNIDVFISCEKPKLKDYIDLMRIALSLILEINPNQISIKAGTNEGLGDIGKGKAIESSCIVLID